MVHVTYDQFLDKFEKLENLKQQYWEALRTKNINLAKQIAKILYNSLFINLVFMNVVGLEVPGFPIAIFNELYFKTKSG